MAQRNRGSSGSSRTGRNERVARIGKTNVSQETKDLIKSWFGVTDSDDVPAKVWGFRGYIDFCRDVPVELFKVWALNYQDNTHTNLIQHILFALYIRGSRGKIAIEQTPIVAEFLLADWQGKLNAKPAYLDGSVQGDNELLEIALAWSKPPEVIPVDTKTIAKEVTQPAKVAGESKVQAKPTTK